MKSFILHFVGSTYRECLVIRVLLGLACMPNFLKCQMDILMWWKGPKMHRRLERILSQCFAGLGIAGSHDMRI